MRQSVSYFWAKKGIPVLFGILVCCLLSGCQGGISIDNLKQLIKPTIDMCWPCTMYKVVFDAIALTINEAYAKISHIALLLLGVGMLFWISFKVMGMVSSIKMPNLRDFLISMLSTFFKAFIVAVVLSMPTYTMAVLDMVATPVLTMFIEMSRTILLSDPTIAKHFSSPGDIQFDTNSNVLLNGTIGYLTQDIVYRVFMALHSGLILGFRMFATIDVTGFLMGGAVVFVFGYLMLVFPLLFIDSFVRLGFVFIFFPLMLTGWVFPSTKQYIGQAWKILFGAMMQILIACVYIALMIGVIKSYSDMHSLSRQFSDPLIILGLKTAATEMLGFMALILTMMKITSKIPAMAGYFGGDATQSEMVKAVQHSTNMMRGVGKVAVGGAMIGTGIGVAAGKKMFEEGTKEAQKAAMQGGKTNVEWDMETENYKTQTDFDRMQGRGDRNTQRNNNSEGDS